MTKTYPLTAYSCRQIKIYYLCCVKNVMLYKIREYIVENNTKEIVEKIAPVLMDL